MVGLDSAFVGMTDGGGGFPRARERRMVGVDSRLRGNDGWVDFRLLLPLPVYGRKSARLFELRRIFLRVMPLLPLRFQPEKQLAIIFLFQNVQ